MKENENDGEIEINSRMRCFITQITVLCPPKAQICQRKKESTSCFNSRIHGKLNCDAVEKSIGEKTKETRDEHCLIVDLFFFFFGTENINSVVIDCKSFLSDI